MSDPKEHLIISSKGQITLPAAMRRALGLTGHAIVTAEARDGRIVLSPAMGVETESWSDAQIRAWDAAEEFGPGARESLRARLARARAGPAPGRPADPGRGPGRPIQSPADGRSEGFRSPGPDLTAGVTIPAVGDYLAALAGPS